MEAPRSTIREASTLQAVATRGLLRTLSNYDRTRHEIVECTSLLVRKKDDELAPNPDVTQAPSFHPAVVADTS